MNGKDINIKNMTDSGQFSFFKEISETQRKILMEKSTVSEFYPRDNIFRQNTRTAHIMYVNSGLIKLYATNENENTVLLKFVTAGEFLGIASYFGDDEYQYSASAIETSQILFIDAGAFKNVLRENNRFMNMVLSHMSYDNMYFVKKILRQSHKSLPGRVADMILYFSQELFKSDHFAFPVTRKEMAEFAGVSTEGLIRTLTEFKNDKLIDLDGTQVVLRSPDLIKTLSRIG